MRLIPIVILFQCVLQFNVVSAVNYDYNLGPFWVAKSGPRSTGGCDDDLDKLAAAYDEALKIAKYAKDAVELIQKPQPHQNVNNNALNARQKKEIINWTRLAQIARVIMGVKRVKYGATGQRDNLGETDQDGAIRLRNMKKMFEDVLQDAANQNPRGEDNWRVFCTTKFIAKKDAGDKIPPQQGDDKERTLTSAQFPHGGYWIEPMGNDFREVVQIIGADWEGNAERDYCPNDEEQGETTFANTIEGWRGMIWCNLGLSMPVKLPPITEKQKLPDESMSLTWLHELMHVKTARQYQPAGVTGNLIIVDEQGVTVEEGKIIQSDDPNALAYGIGQTIALGENFPDKVMTNAESYTMFAVTAYLDQWDWISGDGGTALKHQAEYYASS